MFIVAQSIKGKFIPIYPSPLPLQRHELGSCCFSSASLRRGHLAAVQAIRESTSPMTPASREQRPQEPRADGITWSSCPGSSDDHIQCGHFEVPLDWAKPDSGKARLALAKYDATNSPRKGVLLSNPGPPPSVVFQRAISTHLSHRRSW